MQKMGMLGMSSDFAGTGIFKARHAHGTPLAGSRVAIEARRRQMFGGEGSRQICVGIPPELLRDPAILSEAACQNDIPHLRKT